MAVSEISELIAKYNIRKGDKPGTICVPNPKRLSQSVIDMIVSRKSEILAEFARQEEEEAQRRAEAERAKQEKINKIKSGEDPITVEWHDGEYLSAYEVFGEAAKLLEEIGLAKWIDGWGYRVQLEAVEALGETFTYPQAIEYTRPVREAKAAKKAAAEAEHKAKFDEAKRTGKPVVLSSWSEECNDPNEDCDIDIVTKYAMPDGSTQIKRSHTW